jgi:hypothetical protein
MTQAELGQPQYLIRLVGHQPQASLCPFLHVALLVFAWILPSDEAKQDS